MSDRKKGALNCDNAECLSSQIAHSKSTFLVSNCTLSPIHLEIDHAGKGVVSRAGIVLPARVAETSGLVEGLS